MTFRSAKRPFTKEKLFKQNIKFQYTNRYISKVEVKRAARINLHNMTSIKLKSIIRHR